MPFTNWWNTKPSFSGSSSSSSKSISELRFTGNGEDKELKERRYVNGVSSALLISKSSSLNSSSSDPSNPFDNKKFKKDDDLNYEPYLLECNRSDTKFGFETRYVTVGDKGFLTTTSDINEAKTFFCHSQTGEISYIKDNALIPINDVVNMFISFCGSFDKIGAKFLFEIINKNPANVVNINANEQTNEDQSSKSC